MTRSKIKQFQSQLLEKFSLYQFKNNYKVHSLQIKSTCLQVYGQQKASVSNKIYLLECATGLHQSPSLDNEKQLRLASHQHRFRLGIHNNVQLMQLHHDFCFPLGKMFSSNPWQFFSVDLLRLRLWHRFYSDPSQYCAKSYASFFQQIQIFHELEKVLEVLNILIYPLPQYLMVTSYFVPLGPNFLLFYQQSYMVNCFMCDKF